MSTRAAPSRGRWGASLALAAVLFAGCGSTTTSQGSSTDPDVAGPVDSELPETTRFVSEPTVIQPVETEPIVTEPTVTQPLVTDPVETPPVVTEPIVTEPVETPGEIEPIVTEPLEGGASRTESSEDRNETGTDGAVDYDSADPPPSGVADVVGYFAGGGDPASCDPSEVPEVRLPYADVPPTVELGRPLIVCASGFDPDSPISLAVTGSDGTVIDQPMAALTLDELPLWHWWWFPPAGTPLGTIVLHVTQGSESAQGAAEVVPATGRQIIGMSSNDFHFHGYPPNEVLRLFLFERASNGIDATYVTELPPVPISASGGARYALSPPPPAGRGWCILTELDLEPGPDSPFCGFYA